MWRSSASYVKSKKKMVKCLAGCFYIMEENGGEIKGQKGQAVEDGKSVQQENCIETRNIQTIQTRN
jgi:hypothetical protein